MLITKIPPDPRWRIPMEKVSKQLNIGREYRRWLRRRSGSTTDCVSFGRRLDVFENKHGCDTGASTERRKNGLRRPPKIKHLFACCFFFRNASAYLLGTCCCCLVKLDLIRLTYFYSVCKSIIYFCLMQYTNAFMYFYTPYRCC